MIAWKAGLLTGWGKKNEHFALFWRRIVRDKKLIVRVIVRDCAILRRTKYFISLLKVSVTYFVMLHHCTPLYTIVHQHRARGIFKRWEQCCLQQMCQAKSVCKLISCSWWPIKKQLFYLYFKYRSTTLLTFCYHNQSCFEKPSSLWLRMQLPMIKKQVAVCLFHVHNTSRLNIMLVLYKWFILFQLVIPQSQLPLICMYR